jgi:hypothetical protein
MTTADPVHTHYAHHAVPLWIAGVLATVIWYLITRSLFVSLFSALLATAPLPPRRRLWLGILGAFVPGAIAFAVERLGWVG